MLPPEVLPGALDSAPDAMLIADAAGAIQFASRRAYALLGYAPGELLSCTIEQLIPERFRGSHVQHRARFAEEHRTRPMGTGLELRARRKDGSELPVEISLSPIRYRDAFAFVAAIRDVTERRRIQAQLIAAREAADAARHSADAARHAADRANQAKSRFLATASHDLRQPLQSLALLNGTLRKLVREGEALEALSSQGEAIGAMAHLLNALLDISKLESGAVKPLLTDFPLANLFEGLRAEFAGLAASKGLAFEVPASSHVVHSDPTLVGQILRNLVSNAIKYTSSGHVRVHLAAEPEALRVDVEDSGIGITPEQLRHIYDEFYRASSASGGSRDGYGLGLSIVRRLVSLLDLKLDVRSTPAQGSVFSLTLSLGHESAAAERETPQAQASARSAKTPRVLILEDDRAVRDATRLLLKVEGYRVLTAATLAQASQAAREHTDIDLLVTDYHLAGDETGTEAIAALRALIGPQLKVVLVTGDTSAAIRELEQDAQLLLLRKPIAADELLGKLRSLLPA